MTDAIAAAQAVAAHAEIAKAESLRQRLSTHGHSMSADAKEVLWALVFASEHAATQLIERIKDDAKTAQ